eukprot:c16496_g1_i1.p1 GENE.c16496_g1_i1~~c16496_g1_i1.p1  ORF type:complete len:345 (+),score=79.71 c16496_g1_i1:44-1078(+)
MELKKFIFSSLTVIGVCLSWVGTTQFAKSGTSSNGFTGATFMLYLSTSANVILFPSFLFFKSIIFRQPHNIMVELAKEKKLVTIKSLFKDASFFFILYFLANYMYLKALWYIPASVVAAIFSATPAFVYGLACAPCLLGVPIETMKVIAVLVSIGGTVCFYANAESGNGNALGIILTIASSLCAALYKVLLQFKLGNSSVPTIVLLLTFVGLYNILTIWILVIILEYTGIESIDNAPWLNMLFSTLLGLTFNFLVNFGVCYINALFISLGSLLGIPISAIIDALFRGVKFQLLEYIGAILILIGFVLILAPWTYFYSVKTKTDVGLSSPLLYEQNKEVETTENA